MTTLTARLPTATSAKTTPTSFRMRPLEQLLLAKNLVRRDSLLTHLSHPVLLMLHSVLQIWLITGVSL